MLFQVDNLLSGYGKIDVVRSLSIQVAEGEQVGLFGPNGHGKTTLLRTISGLIATKAGDIRFRGESIEGFTSRQIVERGLIHVPQGNQLFPQMTIIENLRLGAYVKRTTSNQTENLEKVFTLFPRLKERTTQQVRTLSGGERQMLSIGVGLMGMPVLLLLDEPSAGLAPKIKGELADAIGEIAKTGVTMIVVEQDVELLIQLCQRLYLIEKGRVSLETKDVSEVNQTEILEMYFGRVTQ